MLRTCEDTVWSYTKLMSGIYNRRKSYGKNPSTSDTRKIAVIREVENSWCICSEVLHPVSVKLACSFIVLMHF